MKNLLLKTQSVVALALALAACAPNSQLNTLEAQEGQGIIGGKETDGSTPFAKHVVGILGLQGENSYNCTGTLISKNLVLTAAHCVPAEKMLIVFAKNMHSALTSGKTDLVRPVVAKSVHPAWKDSTSLNQKSEMSGDVAILRFEGSIPAGYTTAKLSLSASLLRPEMTIYQIGYGVSDPENKTGSGLLRNTETTILGLAGPGSVVVEQQKGHGVCFGDSGGPSFVKVNDEFVQWGVASSVTSEKDGVGACRQYGIYSGLYQYADWMKEAATKLSGLSF